MTLEIWKGPYYKVIWNVRHRQNKPDATSQFTWRFISRRNLFIDIMAKVLKVSEQSASVRHPGQMVEDAPIMYFVPRVDLTISYPTPCL